MDWIRGWGRRWCERRFLGFKIVTRRVVDPLTAVGGTVRGPLCGRPGIRFCLCWVCGPFATSVFHRDQRIVANGGYQVIEWCWALSFAASFPCPHTKIKEQGYISLKLHVVALYDLNVKCVSSLRDGPSGVEREEGSVLEIRIPYEQSFLRPTLVPVPLEMTFWGFSVINTWRTRVEFLGSPLLSAILQASQKISESNCWVPSNGKSLQKQG